MLSQKRRKIILPIVKKLTFYGYNTTKIELLLYKVFIFYFLRLQYLGVVKTKCVRKCVPTPGAVS